MPATAQIVHRRAVHNAELQPKLIPHLLFPLHLQRRRTDNEKRAALWRMINSCTTSPASMKLTQPYIVGDQQVARHLDSAHYGIELVILDLDTAAEGACRARPSAVTDAPHLTAFRNASSR